MNDLSKFLTYCWVACAIFNGSVTGGCRTPARNQSVNGHPRSRHTFAHGDGAAVDIVLDDPKEVKLCRMWLQRRGYHTHVAEHYEPGQLHVQLHAPEP